MQNKQWKHPGSPLLRIEEGSFSRDGDGFSQGVIMIDYLEQGRMINGAYYAGKLRWLHQER